MPYLTNLPEEKADYRSPIIASFNITSYDWQNTCSIVPQKNYVLGLASITSGTIPEGTSWSPTWTVKARTTGTFEPSYLYYVLTAIAHHNSL
jgi:hypothetical protein